MALSAQNIIDRAATILMDQTHVRWALLEKLDWLNDGRREVAMVRPDIYAKAIAHPLTAGSRQTLPADGLRLLDIPRNSSGTAVSVTRREFLDQQQRGWVKYPGVTEIAHFMLDARSPNLFWVYPPAAGGSSVELIYQATPTDFSGTNSTVTGTFTPMEEMYGGAFVDYVCYRAFSKDSEYAGAQDRAETHYNHFMNALKGGKVVDMVTSANASNIGGVPDKALAYATGA